MALTWRSVWQRREDWLKAGLLVVGLWIALVAAVPIYNSGGIAESRATGLAAMSKSSSPLAYHSLSRRVELSAPSPALMQAGVVGAIPGSSAAYFAAASFSSDVADSPRKVIRTSSLDLEVTDPANATEAIRKLADSLGGYVVTSAINGEGHTAAGSITIRVPIERFEDARAAIKRLAVHVQSEQLQANDVTKQYVDQEARLRNLRAQEIQYLAILKRASTVKDTLETSEKLNDVRGEIEQQQAEFEALTQQVQTVVVTVTLRGEADTMVFGLHWRPLYQLKLAMRDGVDSLANYATAMLAGLFQLPAILLWLATVVFIAALAWRILRWIWKSFLVTRPAAAARAS